jgi:hypothetical protein
MNNNQTQSKLTDMRLYGMMNLNQRYSENPKLMPEAPQEFFASMVDAEHHCYRQCKTDPLMPIEK